MNLMKYILFKYLSIILLLFQTNICLSNESDKGFLGAQIKDLTNEIKKSINSRNLKGAYVVSVQKDGPAFNAGIRSKDLIISFDDKAIDDAKTLYRLVRQNPEKNIRINVFRDGLIRQFIPKIGNFNEPEDMFKNVQKKHTPKKLIQQNSSSKNKTVSSKKTKKIYEQKNKTKIVQKKDLIKEKKDNTNRIYPFIQYLRVWDTLSPPLCNRNDYSDKGSRKYLLFKTEKFLFDKNFRIYSKFSNKKGWVCRYWDKRGKDTYNIISFTDKRAVLADNYILEVRYPDSSSGMNWRHENLNYSKKDIYKILNIDPLRLDSFLEKQYIKQTTKFNNDIKNKIKKHNEKLVKEKKQREEYVRSIKNICNKFHPKKLPQILKENLSEQWRVELNSIKLIRTEFKEMAYGSDCILIFSTINGVRKLSLKEGFRKNLITKEIIRNL